MVAIDADGREIADPGKARHSAGEDIASGAEHRIAGLARRGRDDRDASCWPAPIAPHPKWSRRRKCSGSIPAARNRSNFSGERVVPATNASPETSFGKGASGIAGAEDEEAPDHDGADQPSPTGGEGRAPAALRHSLKTSASVSAAACRSSPSVEFSLVPAAATAPTPPRRGPAARGRQAAGGMLRQVPRRPNCRRRSARCAKNGRGRCA